MIIQFIKYDLEHSLRKSVILSQKELCANISERSQNMLKKTKDLSSKHKTVIIHDKYDDNL